jgi:heat shock protein HtpX
MGLESGAWMYEQIAKNKRASLELLANVVAIWLLLGLLMGLAITRTAAGGVDLLGCFGVLALVFGLLAYYRGSSLLLRVSHAREVSHDEAPQLWNVVAELSVAAGIPRPKVFIIDDLSPNAFATGRDPAHAAVAATSGLLHRMNREELQGVMAHELAHIRNYDVRFATLVGVLVGMIALTSDYFLRSSAFRMAGSRVRNLASVLILAMALALAVVAPLSARLVQLAISRRREYLADASAVEITRDPLALASALEKIDGDPRPVAGTNRATAHLYIANPIKRTSGDGLFDTHPPTEKRIAILRSMVRVDSLGSTRAGTEPACFRRGL